jgi:glycosyltransferase involved in cell wall biosynthesis
MGMQLGWKGLAKSLSIIMPAYNVEDVIENCVKNVRRLMESLGIEDYEIIAVDDGSKDGTLQRLLKLSSAGNVKVLSNGINIGKGFAVKGALNYATKDYSIVIDADMEIDPKQIKYCLKALKHSDVIIASKRHPQSHYRAPLLRKFLSIGFNVLVQILTGLKFGDTQSGLKAFRTDTFKKIMRVVSVKRYAYDVEVLSVAKLLNLRVAEMPIRIEQSSGFSLRAVLYMFIDLLGIVYRLKVIKWYQKNLENEEPKYKPILRL